MKYEWETIDGYNFRMKVPGGWVLKVLEDVAHEIEMGRLPGWDWRVAICFIPDPDHKWVIDK